MRSISYSLVFKSKHNEYKKGDVFAHSLSESQVVSFYGLDGREEKGVTDYVSFGNKGVVMFGVNKELFSKLILQEVVTEYIEHTKVISPDSLTPYAR